MSDDVIDEQVFDALAQSTGREFVAELVQVFLAEAPNLLEELRAAHAAGNAERFRRAAHSLKTNALTFGATTLAGLARALEHGGLPTGPSGLDTLETAYATAANALEERAHD
jgi:HPt (histidine-containing phosphotransfer) domain-containing protein